MSSRRRLLETLAGLSSAVGIAGCLDRSSGPVRETNLELAANPHAADLPERQHARTERLRRDADGNPLSPRYHAILLADLEASPSVETGRTIE